MKKQYFDKLIENAKAENIDCESVTITAEYSNYYFMICASLDEDYKFYIDFFGQKIKGVWTSQEPTPEQNEAMQNLINANIPEPTQEYEQEDRYINKYEYHGVKPSDFL